MLVLSVVAFQPPVAAQEATMVPDGSIVFIADHDVWIASPDGKQRRPITDDGTEASAYHDPSQASDGSILAIRGLDMLHRYDRTGSPLADPVQLVTLEHGAEGLVVAPTADRVAYATVGTGVRVDPRYGNPTGIYLYGGTDVATLDGAPVADGVAASMIHPDWIDPERLAVSNGVELWTYVPGSTDAPSVWLSFTDGCVTDFDCPRGSTAYATISQPVVSADAGLVAYTYSPFFGDAGRRVARIEAGRPASDAICLLPGQDHSLHPLSFSPDASMLAFDDAIFDPGTFTASPATGIRVMSLDVDSAECGLAGAEMTIVGGAQPEWGPLPP